MNTNYKKGFAPLVIILLVVLGVGVVGGGYVLYKDKQQQEKLETQIQDLQNQSAGDTSDTSTQKVVDKNPSSTTEKLVITFPTKGAVLVEGQTYNITLNNSISATTHSVSLEDKAGNLIGLMPETGATILGKSISWKVPFLELFGERKVLPGDGFRIRIFAKGKSQESYYSPVFSIIAPENKNPTVSLAVQAGLPPAVEAKRQAIYKAAISRDINKLKAELVVSKDIYTLSGFGADGKSGGGISGFSNTAQEEKNVNIFDLIPTFLKLPYSVTTVGSVLPYVQNWWASANLSSNTVLYVWPYVFTKSPPDLTDADIANMRTFFSEQQINNFRQTPSYFNIVITADGKWVSSYGPRD